MNWVIVLLKDTLLEEINEEVKREGTNRSALIKTVLEKYIEAKRREREGEEKRNMEKASHKIYALAKKLEKWDPQATIRNFRDTNLKDAS